MAQIFPDTPRACDRARSLVSLRLDDELSEFEQTLLDAHLEGCVSCAAFSVDVLAAATTLRTAALVPLETPLRLPALRKHAGLRALQTAAAGAVAAAAVVAGLVGVSPALVGIDRSERLAATSWVEPVSPRVELALRDRGVVRGQGPAGTSIPL